jgi:2-alkenal reductase
MSLVRALAAAVIAIIAIMIGSWLLMPTVRSLLFAADEPRAVAPRGDLGPNERLTIELFQRTSPAVVHIVVEQGGRTFLEGGQEAPQASGTGFLWDAAGHIVTNAHVVGQARSARVRLGNGDVVSARVVGRAPNVDLAVLQVQGIAALPPPITVGSSSDLQVGQSVLAIGNPFGLDQTLTTGVISALRRRLPAQTGREIADVIQTDAAINPGNSGGPLLDSAGRLIGVNTAIYSPSGASAGIGFAIPADTVNRVVPILIRDGRVPNPVIGVVLASEATTTRLGIEGLVVVGVAPGSPAARAGLQGVDQTTGAIGDIIVAANGQKVAQLADLASTLEAAGIGATIPLEILRDGRRMTVNVEIADAEAEG